LVIWTIRSWASCRSVVENPDAGSLNTTSASGGGCGDGCEIDDGADAEGDTGVGADEEPLQPASP
jgi:hypothetical protein